MDYQPVCSGPSVATCPAHAPVAVKEALIRFRTEATQGTCDTGRYRCPYYVWGEGPPLLFIHGIADVAESFVLLSALLSKRFRCIASDLPDGRRDGARLDRYTHSQLVDDAFALLDHLNVKQSYVFGSSFGSTIALAALKQKPERMPRAILQGGFAHSPLAPAELLLARCARYWPGSMRAVPLRKTVLHHTHSGPFAGRPEKMWDFFLEKCGTPAINAVAHRALLVHRVDLRESLPEISQPVLLVCGERDPRVARQCEEVLLEGLPNAGRVEIPGCGHNPLFSHPESLAEIVAGFLTPSG